MIRALVFLLGAALMACSVSMPSEAGSLRMRGVAEAPPVIQCPYAIDNGCADSPGGSFQVANFFDGYIPDFTANHRPNANMAGIDYANGMPAVSDPSWTGTVAGYSLTGACGKDEMVDPAEAEQSEDSNDPGCGIIPMDCTYTPNDTSAPDGTGFAIPVGLFYCTGGNDVVIRGFNCAQTVNSNACYFRFATCTAGSKIIAFNEHISDESSYSSSGWAGVNTGAQCDIGLFANTFNGRYQSNFAYNAEGTGSQSGTTITISACTVCEYRVGMQISTGGQYTIIKEQLSGTPRGVGTYDVNVSATISSRAMGAGFHQYGAFGFNTGGDIDIQYNALVDANSRGFGAFSQRAGSGTATNVGLVTVKYNYNQGGLFDTSAVHYEIIETVLADGNRPMTWDEMVLVGNTFYSPAEIATSSVTGMFFISTGAVASMAEDYYSRFADVTITDNVAVAMSGVDGGTVLARMGGSFFTDMEMSRNYAYRGPADLGQYAACTAAPQTGGDSPTAFFQATQTGTTMTVSLWQGNAVIEPGYHVRESNLHVVSQLTNTNGLGEPGKEGTYEMSGSATMNTGNKRAAPDAFTNDPVIAGNYDLLTGPLTESEFFQLSTISSPCMHPSRAS